MNAGKVILVYKTNISTNGQRESLQDIFGPKPGVLEWSVDLEDIDKVLRVVCEGEQAFDVAAEVRMRGFDCEELE